MRCEHKRRGILIRNDQHGRAFSSYTFSPRFFHHLDQCLVNRRQVGGKHELFENKKREPRRSRSFWANLAHSPLVRKQEDLGVGISRLAVAPGREPSRADQRDDQP